VDPALEAGAETIKIAVAATLVPIAVVTTGIPGINIAIANKSEEILFIIESYSHYEILDFRLKIKLDQIILCGSKIQLTQLSL
jgi:hypothetical protein